MDINNFSHCQLHLLLMSLNICFYLIIPEDRIALCPTGGNRVENQVIINLNVKARFVEKNDKSDA